MYQNKYLTGFFVVSMVYSSIGIDVFDGKSVYLLRISLRTNIVVDILSATDAALVSNA